MVDTALTVAAVCGVLCMLMATAALVFGITPLVFRSGSMAPAITTGSVALAREVPATQAVPGDVVSVVADNGTRITHRVVDVGEPTGNSVPLMLKGDANAVADASPYVVTEVARVTIDVPYLGYVVAWLSTPTAIAAGVILTGWLLAVAFWPGRRPRRPDPAGNDSHPRIARHRPDPSASTFPRPQPREGRWALSHEAPRWPAVVATIALVGGVALAHPPTARAALTDVTVGQVNVPIGTVPRPSSITCTNSFFPGIAGLISWPVVSPTARYRLNYVGAVPYTETVAAQASGTITVNPRAAVELSVGYYTVEVYTLLGDNFVSPAPPMMRRILVGAGQSSCQPTGTTTTPGNNGATGAAAARTAPSTSPSGSPSSTGPSSTETTGPTSSSTTEPSPSETSRRPETSIEEPPAPEQPTATTGGSRSTTESTTEVPSAAEPERDPAGSSSTSTSPRGYDPPVT